MLTTGWQHPARRHRLWRPRRRRLIVCRMDALRATMTADDAPGIAGFRRLHIRGMLINVAQLGVVVWGLVRLSPPAP